MNMFLHELKSNRKSTIIWTCSLSLLVIFFLSIFPSFAQNAEEVKKMLMGFPESIRKVIGSSFDIISTLPGFYSYFFQYVLLFGGIQAMNLGLSTISKETRDKTADFLLTKPVSRTSIMTAKISAALVSLIITDLVYLATTSIMARTVSKDFDMKIFLMISVTLLFVQLIFLAIGVITSVSLKKIKSVIAVSLGTAFSFLIISFFASTTGDKAIRYISPFSYFDPIYIIKNGSYENIFLVIEFIFILLAISASYIIYSKKDIDTV